MATISCHGGSQVCKKHNERDYETCKNEKHIDLSRPHENWINYNHREFYHKLFDDALKEYNKKQKRSDRKIKDYYDKIRKDNKKHTCYELILGVYDKDISNDIKREILKEFVDTFEERNPNMKIVGAYFHNDEESEDCHVHLDYVPISFQNKRGLAVQNSLSRAFNEMGYYTKNNKLTAQIQWFNKQRDYLDDLCQKRGIKVERNLDKREHLDTALYKEAKALTDKAENEIIESIEKINKINENDKWKNVFYELEQIQKEEIEYPKVKKILTKEYVEKKDYDALRSKFSNAKDVMRFFTEQFKSLLYVKFPKMQKSLSNEKENLRALVETIKRIPAKAKQIEIRNINVKLMQEVDDLKQRLSNALNQVDKLQKYQNAYYNKVNEMNSLNEELSRLKQNSVSRNEYNKTKQELNVSNAKLRNVESLAETLLIEDRGFDKQRAKDVIEQVEDVEVEEPKIEEKHESSRFKYRDDDFELER